MPTRRITTTDRFKEFANGFWSDQEKPFAWGIGEKIFDSENKHVTTRPIVLNVGEHFGSLAAILDYNKAQVPSDISVVPFTKSPKILVENYFAAFSTTKRGKHYNLKALNSFRQTDDRKICIIIYPTRESLDQPIVDHVDAIFRLKMFHDLHVLPNTISLEGLFDELNNLYYTSNGAYTHEDWVEYLATHRGKAPDTLLAVDKFPPAHWLGAFAKGVRVANVAQVRGGGHLESGTTVMHAGFVNFNAGSTGPKTMIEGRVSAGVVLGEGTDIGGGASTMGTLSGGGDQVIVIGKNTLIGANGGTGISLGDRCTIEAGTYVHSKKKVLIMSNHWKDEGFEKGQVVKALDLSGLSDMKFIDNSETDGGLELHFNDNPNKTNPALHKNS